MRRAADRRTATASLRRVALIGALLLGGCGDESTRADHAMPATSTTADGAMTGREGESLRTQLAMTDLVVTLTGADQSAPGDTMWFVIVVRNDGPNPATSTSLIVDRDGPMSFVAADGCTIDAATLRCQLDELLARTERAVTVEARADAAGTATVRARVSNNAGPDTDEADNERAVSLTISGVEGRALAR